jgi:Caspase domain
MKNRHALLIGINEYPNLAKEAQLKGCDNDVHELKTILIKQFGFMNNDIVVLLDEQAKRESILENFRSLHEKCKKDDLIVLLYSGHGSRILTKKPNKPSDYYETIVPYDSGRKYSNQKNLDITDDEIREWLTSLAEKTSNICLIFDCCFAASAVRSDQRTNTFQIKGIPPDDTLLKSPEVSIFDTDKNTNLQNTRSHNQGNLRQWAALDENYVLLAACDETQVARLYFEQINQKVKHYGLFSYFLHKALRAANPKTTYLDIWDEVKFSVQEQQSEQIPQLEGKKHRVLFKTEEIISDPFLNVTARKDKFVTLSGGEVLGVVKGSKWEIYSHGVKNSTEKQNALGLVEVISVKSSASEALVLDERQENLIAPGTRAFNTFLPYGSSRLKVWIDKFPPRFEDLALHLNKCLQTNTFLTRVSAQDSAQASIRLVEPIGKNDLISSKAPKLGIFNSDDKLFMISDDLSDEKNVKRIVRKLERISKSERVLGLENSKSKMKNKIEFFIYKKIGNKWQEVKSSANCSSLLVNTSDTLSIRIINNFECPVFISILDIGLTRKLSLLYPKLGGCRMIGAKTQQSTGLQDTDFQGKVCDVGRKPNENFILSLPDDFPEELAGNYQPPKQGLEIFKLFITTELHDLSFLIKDEVRDIERVTSDFETLFLSAYRGTETDESKLMKKWKGEWFTIQKRFILRES